MKRDFHTANSRSCSDSLIKKFILRLAIGPILLQILYVPFSLALDPHKQISQYGYSAWSRQNGLPANGVHVAIQSHDGYIWLGTTAGLLRFDGVRFEAISTDTADSKHREVIVELCETRDSTIWIGTRYAGLRRLKNGKLLPCGPKEGFPIIPIKELFESREGHLWIASTDGLFEYIDGRFKSIPTTSVFITSITEDESGKIFIGTGKGVHSFDEGRAKYIRSILQKDGLPNEMITTVYADHQRNIWIGTEYGFVRWNNNKIITEKIFTNPGLLHVTSMCEDRNGNLWIGTTQGIFRFSEGNWTTFKAADGLLSDNVLNILEDEEGSIWVCTSEGLSRFRDVNVTTYTTQEGLVNNYLTSVLETDDGSIYFLSAASGGSISKLKGEKITHIANPPPVGPSFLAHDGSIWTALSGSLSHIINDHVIRYDTTSGLPNRFISAITEDSLSLIMYFDHIGIRRFIDGRLKPYLMINGEPYASTDYVSCLYQEPRGILWIGTSSGLVKIQNGKSTTYGVSDGMADEWVFSIFDAQLGNLWIGSPRGGLTHYRDGKFIVYNTQKGLFTNEIYSVIVDDRGDVWMSSPRGIGYLNRKDVEEYESGRISVVSSGVFTTADGMRTDECFGGWQPSAWKAKDGRLWFATVKGAVVIDPKMFKHNKVPPPVYIEQFIADMQTVRSDQFESLQPGREKLEFHYTALSYLVPDRVFFKYKLDGYDREWVEAGTRRVAYYTNLPSGSYKFRVVACNNDGVWNETDASVAFELLPHFYQTFWFYGLLLFVCGGIVFGIHRLRVWQLLQREKDLEQRVHDRTKQLEAANKELEAFSYSVSHDLRAPLRSIDGFSVALLEDYTDKLDERGKNYLQRVRAASQHMGHLIDDILNLSRVMRSDMQRTSVDLSSLAQSIANELRRTQPDRKVSFIITPGMVVHADHNLMVVVLENLLDNSWKFTSKHPTSKIEIGNTLREGQKVYFVRDDGDGFDMTYAGKLFGAFQRMHTPAEFNGTGIGLATVRRIIYRHGGRVWAEAEKDKGATFYFTIP